MGFSDPQQAKEKTMPRPSRTTPKATRAKAKSAAKPRVKLRIHEDAMTRRPVSAFDPDPVQPWQPETDASDARIWSNCGTCGGPVTIGSGAYLKPWMIHHACRRLATEAERIVAAVGEVLGVEVTMLDAALLRFRLPMYSEVTGHEPVGGRPARAWAWLDKRELRAAVKQLPDLRADAGIDPHPCTLGPCCWCGVRVAGGWEDHGHRWADGSSAPMCGSCSEQFVRRGGLSGFLSAQFYDEQRRAGYEVLAGDLPMGHEQPEAFRLYAEVAEPDRAGHDVPFGYVAADRRPGTPEFRERVEREQAEALARAEAEQAAKAEAERRRAEEWGFRS